MVTILRRNVPVVCDVSYHLLGYQISQDSKTRFRLQVESYISNWLSFSESRLLASYVSRHKAMAYDTTTKKLTQQHNWKKSSSSPRVASVFGLCLSFCPSVRAKRGIWSKRVFMRTNSNFSFSVRLRNTTIIH
jgi:hypothetical protein